LSIEEPLVDAYGESEQITAFCTMIEVAQKGVDMAVIRDFLGHHSVTLT
jgi:hypothetical protein